MTRSKQEALSEITALVAEAGLTQSDLLSLLPQKSPSSGEETEDSSSLLQRVMVYVGGLFIFTGVCVYIGIVWEDLPSLARVLVSFGTGLVAFILGLVSLNDPRYSKASTPLLIISAFFQPGGLFILLDEYFPSSHDTIKAMMVVFGFMAVQQFVAFASRNRSSLLFFSLSFFYLFLSALIEKTNIEPPDSAMLLGLSGLYVSYGLTKTIHRSLSPFFFFFSGLAVAAASFDYFEDTSFDVLLIGVSGALIALSVFAKSRTLLTVSVISLLAFLGYFTDEYFRDIVSWPITLIIFGFLMIGISVFAVKLGKKIKQSS